MTRAHVIAWRTDLERRSLAPATQRRKLAALSSLFQYLCERNAVLTNPAHGMTRVSRPYKTTLLEGLKDPQEAAEYLNAALEENESELFLLALRNVAEAHGIKKLAEDTHLNRESMYRMLSEQGNPQLSSLTTILKEMGLRLAVEVEEIIPA